MDPLFYRFFYFYLVLLSSDFRPMLVQFTKTKGYRNGFTDASVSDFLVKSVMEELQGKMDGKNG